MDWFEQLYSLYFSKIYNLAYRMTGNSEASADITQETFTQVIMKKNIVNRKNKDILCK